jgi:hypothetical protein
MMPTYPWDHPTALSPVNSLHTTIVHAGTYHQLASPIEKEEILPKGSIPSFIHSIIDNSRKSSHFLPEAAFLTRPTVKIAFPATLV